MFFANKTKMQKRESYSEEVILSRHLVEKKFYIKKLTKFLTKHQDPLFMYFYWTIGGKEIIKFAPSEMDGIPSCKKT